MIEGKSTGRSWPNEVRSLKILVAEDAQGKVWFGYIRPSYLQQRRNLRPALDAKRPSIYARHRFSAFVARS
jgi:hypothetical protein